MIRCVARSDATWWKDSWALRVVDPGAEGANFGVFGRFGEVLGPFGRFRAFQGRIYTGSTSRGILEGFGLNADSQGFLGIPGRLARNPPGQLVRQRGWEMWSVGLLKLSMTMLDATRLSDSPLV